MAWFGGSYLHCIIARAHMAPLHHFGGTYRLSLSCRYEAGTLNANPFRGCCDACGG
jgi:hypothetical protein